jgi:ADP-ribose pyrophosphatase
VKTSDEIRETEGWQTISSETHFRNQHLAVSTLQVRSPARTEPRSWTIVYRKPAVVIAPLTARGELVLIRQERITIRSAIWEVPAGQIDESSDLSKETIEAVALRELREETGFELADGGELVPLGDYFSSPGFTDEHGYFFLARAVQLSAGGQAHGASEAILDCRAFPVDEVRRMIAENEIRDANTLSIWARLVARRLLALPLR